MTETLTVGILVVVVLMVVIVILVGRIIVKLCLKLKIKFKKELFCFESKYKSFKKIKSYFNFILSNLFCFKNYI